MISELNRENPLFEVELSVSLQSAAFDSKAKLLTFRILEGSRAPTSAASGQAEKIYHFEVPVARLFVSYLSCLTDQLLIYAAD